MALGGVVRGTGSQAAAAPCTVASYYLLGLPAAAVLAFSLNLGEPCCLNVWFMLVCMALCATLHCCKLLPVGPASCSCAGLHVETRSVLLPQQAACLVHACVYGVLAFPLKLGESCCLYVWFMLVCMVFLSHNAVPTAFIEVEHDFFCICC